MQMFVEVGCKNGEDLLHFYVDELRFFDFCGDYGVGCFKLLDRDRKFGFNNSGKWFF